MPTKLPLIATVRGTPEYQDAVKALADTAGYRTVADLIEQSLAKEAARHRVALPPRWSRVAGVEAKAAPSASPKKSRKKVG